jgi:hypothetical protein
MPAPLVTTVLGLAAVTTALDSYAAVAIGAVAVIIQVIVNNSIVNDGQ